MIDRRTYIVIGAVALLFTGCIAEEDPIAPYDRGNAADAMVEMGSDYRYQVFFDVETASIVKSNLIVDWDLGFRSDPGGHHIVLNEAKIMSAADLGPVDFVSVTSKDDLTWDYDRSTGEWDSTAIGEWWTQQGDGIVSKGHVYVVDRGFGPDGRGIGHYKMSIVSATPASYIVRIAKLNNSEDRTIEIPRDTTRNIVGLSFNDGGKLFDIEPPKADWDLLFTRYTHIFYEPEFTPYSVTGILLNRYSTLAAIDSSLAFEEVTSDRIESFEYSGKLDRIGYDWKVFDLQSGVYTVNSPVYIVKDSKGFFFKLHLLDFYNQNGEKGYPRIVSQKL